MKTKDILISDFDQKRLQPASYDVLLGKEFMVFKSHQLGMIDPKESVENAMYKIVLEKEGDFFVIHPNEFVLAVTKDRIGVSEKYACQIMGKSSLARMGLLVHTTAGFIDPGNNLNITLELVNCNNVAIKLYAGMKIAQVAFYQLKTATDIKYGSAELNSKYLNSTTVQASAMHKNFK